jgi:hypothetical protein
VGSVRRIQSTFVFWPPPTTIWNSPWCKAHSADLFFRLNVLTSRLSGRRRDIPLLVAHVATASGRDNGTEKQSDEALRSC